MRQQAWITIAYVLLVILWGAFVRATGSGAGCGDHWPLCNGQFIPRDMSVQRMIEFSHRLTSGLSLVAVLLLAKRARSQFPIKSLVRRAANASVVLIFLEALIGAGLVLLKLVAHDESVARAVSIAIHLINTLALMASLTAVAIWSGQAHPKFALPKGRSRWVVILLVFGFCFVAASGAITALGDTLFPARTWAEGIAQDMSPASHFLIQLRVFHPLLAVTVGLGAMGWILSASDSMSSGKRVLALIAANWLVGVVNVMLLAPIPLQIIHLLMGNLIWISFVIFVLEIAAKSEQTV